MRRGGTPFMNSTTSAPSMIDLMRSEVFSVMDTTFRIGFADSGFPLTGRWSGGADGATDRPLARCDAKVGPCGGVLPRRLILRRTAQTRERRIATGPVSERDAAPGPAFAGFPQLISPEAEMPIVPFRPRNPKPSISATCPRRSTPCCRKASRPIGGISAAPKRCSARRSPQRRKNCRPITASTRSTPITAISTRPAPSRRPACEKAARQAGWPGDWREWRPAGDIPDGAGRFALYTLKALAFIHLRRDEKGDAEEMLDALRQLDPTGAVGWPVSPNSRPDWRAEALWRLACILDPGRRAAQEPRRHRCRKARRKPLNYKPHLPRSEP